MLIVKCKVKRSIVKIRDEELKNLFTWRLYTEDPFFFFYYTVVCAVHKSTEDSEDDIYICRYY